MSENRVLIHAPRGRDAQVLEGLLRPVGLVPAICADKPQLLALLNESAACAIVTEETLADGPQAPLVRWLAEQPSWSDFPFIVLAARQDRRRSDRALADLRELGNLVLLERPADAETIARAALSAVRARRRQYAMRTQLQELAEARHALELLNSSLESRIAERTAALAGANDRLMAEIAERERAQSALTQSQKMEALGQLTGGIAHDFNNLLHVVNMNLDLVTRLSRDEKVHAIAVRAKSAVGRGAHLTGQLLAFARRQSLMPKPTDIGAVLLGLRELLALSVGPQIAVECHGCDPHDGPLGAVVDANQLEMAVLNLAVNARDAMPGGGRIVVRAARTADGGTELPPGDYIVVSVADTGTGIAPDVLARVFEPFFTTKPVGSGTGLGLAQVYGFARQSGGLARVRSALGVGTTVEIVLPLHAVPAEAGAAPAPAAAQAPDGQQRRVLVVEDDAGVRRVIVESLQLLGYAVDEAPDAPSALATLSVDAPDLLVVDYAMPGMNGAQLIEAARAAGATMPVVLATGYADMAEVARLVGLRFTLGKPFDIATLGRTVAEALSNP